MNRTSIITVIFSLLIFTYSFSSPVSSSDAQKAAYNFMSHKMTASGKHCTGIVLRKSILSDDNKGVMYYIFDVQPEGFILMSADDAMHPVIAYSTEGYYSEEKNPVQAWFTHLQVSLAYSNLVSDKTNFSRWENLKTPLKQSTSKGVTALCTTKWNQDTHYNYYCPIDSSGPGNRAYAGCVATAMGQVMKRWNHPINGSGGYAYQHIWPMYYNNYGVVQANFAATTYNWSNMPNQINTSNREDVATLLYHCGVAVKMNYGPDGSGAHTEDVVFALRHYFKYNEGMTFLERAYMLPERWDSTIIDQLEKGYPLVYSGSTTTSGHAWVVDGYQDSCYFHVNWGWSGWNNGYYYFSNLNSGNGDFTNYQGAVIDVYPQGYTPIATHQTNSTFGFYPNPASDYIHFKDLKTDSRINIYNMNGALVKSDNARTMFYVGDLTPGIYITEIVVGNNISRSRLSIVR